MKRISALFSNFKMELINYIIIVYIKCISIRVLPNELLCSYIEIQVIGAGYRCVDLKKPKIIFFPFHFSLGLTIL